MNTFVMDPQRSQLIQSEKMSAAGNLLAGIVHELNNPLTTILGFSELLLREGHITDPSRIKKIHSEAERSVRIIQNVLRLARTDEDSETQIIDINEAVQRTVEIAGYQLRLNRIEFELSLSENKPKVLAHPGELTQVMLNLVTNAIQAISGSGRSGTIQIKSVVVCGRIRISVTDDGPGISPSDFSRIFEPFFTTKQTGTGLGLSLSKRILRELGGDLSATNNRGCGATFTLDLPIVEDLTSETDDSCPAAPNILAPDRSVLIVDDEDHITELVENVLQDCGYRTDRLSDGRPAIELMKQNDYDILICDLHMPDVSGRDLIEWTRLNKQNMRVLLLSGDVASKDVSDFARAFGIHFLSKPFSVAELTKAVQRLFS
jgi:two-component system NtrC family sensor kinase